MMKSPFTILAEPWGRFRSWLRLRRMAPETTQAQHDALREALAELTVMLSAAEDLHTSKEVKEHARERLFVVVMKHYALFVEVSPLAVATCRAELNAHERAPASVKRCLANGPEYSGHAALHMLAAFERVCPSLPRSLR